jgi:hypothetical protein
MQRISDEEILQIFKHIDEPGCEAIEFVKAFAHAVCLAPRRDFVMMRPFSLIVIGKYNLGPYCERVASAISSPRTTSCTFCDDTGWRPVGGSGDRRVTRCECRLPVKSSQTEPVIARQVEAAVDSKFLAAGDR